MAGSASARGVETIRRMSRSKKCRCHPYSKRACFCSRLRVTVQYTSVWLSTSRCKRPQFSVLANGPKNPDDIASLESSLSVRGLSFAINAKAETPGNMLTPLASTFPQPHLHSSPQQPKTPGVLVPKKDMRDGGGPNTPSLRDPLHTLTYMA